VAALSPPLGPLSRPPMESHPRAHPMSKVRSAAARTFASLENRNYRWYFSGQSLSMVGTWMQMTTQSWLVLTLTNSGVQLGLVIALQTLPILVLGPVGGTIADRFGKYRILFVTQALAGVQALVLGGLELSGHLQLWELYILAVSLGLINMVDNPTRQTFIVEMVGREQLPNAVTLNSVMVNVARAVGPAVAGVLIAAVGSGWCFLLNGVSFAFVLIGLKMIDQDQLTPTPRATRMKGQLVAGFRYVARTPLLRDTLIMMALVGMLAYEFQVSLPLMARHAFHGGSALYGFLNSAQGAGAIVGGLVAASRAGRGARRLVNTALAFGVVILLAAVAPNAATEIIALLFVGAASVTFLSLGNSTLQLESEPSMRGRVMSLWSVAFQGSTPIGGPLVGAVGGALGARYGLGLGGVACLAAAALGYRGLIRRQALEAVPVAPAAPADPVPGEGVPTSGDTVSGRAVPGAPRADGPQRDPTVARPA
jgi:MFS family permease